MIRSNVEIVSLSAGARFGQYSIVSTLGTGGMGEVYLAEDTRLGRRVALKVLPTKFTSDDDRVRRFEREARAASALNHPNIITIYEIGQVDSTRFISTEFIEGLTITQKGRGRPIDTLESVDIALQVSGALQAAHRAGIIHRDIKSENIMVRPDGYVKVLDFGLAKLTEAFPSGDDVDLEGETRKLAATSPGMIMGTVSYMSPEQARGFRVDGRSDIFSLGIVFYEMLTGKLPFPGETASDIIAAILNRDVESLHRHVGGVPDRLDWIVRKMLAKQPLDRFQTAAELTDVLKWMKRQLEPSGTSASSSSGHDIRTLNLTDEQATRPTVLDLGDGVSGQRSSSQNDRRLHYDTNPIDLITSPLQRFLYQLRHPIRYAKGGIALGAILIAIGILGAYYVSQRAPEHENAIAVVPFLNVSADAATGDIADGITQGLIKNLSRLPRLRVRPLASVLKYKSTALQSSLPDLRTVGQDLNVPVILTGRIERRSSGLSLNIELIDARNMSYIWGRKYDRTLSELLALDEEITREVSEQLKLNLDGHDKAELEAYQYYLRGRYYLSKRTSADLQQGIEAFNAAIARDADFALAYAGLADCYNMLTTYGRLTPDEGFAKSKAAAETSIRLDDRLAEGHTALAYVKHRYDGKWADAEREFKRAIDLDPNYAPARQWYSSLLVASGRQREAIAEARRCQEIDPLSLIVNSHLAYILYLSERYDESIEQCKKVLTYKEDFFPALRYQGLALEQVGKLDEAIAVLSRARELSGRSQLLLGALGHAYAVSGNRAKALEAMNELMRVAPDGRFNAFEVAVIHTGLGEKEKALQLLQKAVDEHNDMQLLPVDPRLKSLRSDPRFVALIKKIGVG